ncbi:hypothetical protein DY000_02023408 [Brassica cretica]|uniref:CASP-like protein n=1 Tax=Brassica cretica TaxID=69181 RepID=A0ABQ7E194_BRACR|nr:hypothetical protein DY000_02023408 [Brassica cretica]
MSKRIVVLCVQGLSLAGMSSTETKATDLARYRLLPRALVCCVVSSFASSALSVVLCLRRPSSPYDNKSNVLMKNLMF